MFLLHFNQVAAPVLYPVPAPSVYNRGYVPGAHDSTEVRLNSVQLTEGAYYIILEIINCWPDAPLIVVDFAQDVKTSDYFYHLISLFFSVLIAVL